MGRKGRLPARTRTSRGSGWCCAPMPPEWVSGGHRVLRETGTGFSSGVWKRAKQDAVISVTLFLNNKILSLKKCRTFNPINTVSHTSCVYLFIALKFTVTCCRGAELFFKEKKDQWTLESFIHKFLWDLNGNKPEKLSNFTVEFRFLFLFWGKEEKWCFILLRC